MKFEETGSKMCPHKLTFEGNEIMVVRAVFRELIHNLATKGNSGSISNYDARIARWEDYYMEDEERSVLVRHYEHMVERLIEFHENTDRAISDIPNSTGLAAFMNEDIPFRHELGNDALLLAKRIRNKAAEYISSVVGNLDEDFSELLGDEHPSE